MVINKYLAGLLTLAITLLTAFVAVPQAAWADQAVVWQFVALVVGTFTTIFLPLLSGPWAGALKTGSAVILAAIGALVPLLAGDFGPLQWGLLGIAALNALAIELGVQIRVDSAKDIIVTPTKNTTVVQEIDPKASVIATRQITVAHDGRGGR